MRRCRPCQALDSPLDASPKHPCSLGAGGHVARPRRLPEGNSLARRAEIRPPRVTQRNACISLLSKDRFKRPRNSSFHLKFWMPPAAPSAACHTPCAFNLPCAIISCAPSAAWQARGHRSTRRTRRRGQPDARGGGGPPTRRASTQRVVDESPRAHGVPAHGTAASGVDGGRGGPRPLPACRRRAQCSGGSVEPCGGRAER